MSGVHKIRTIVIAHFLDQKPHDHWNTQVYFAPIALWLDLPVEPHSPALSPGPLVVEAAVR
jgi:hypothetical protein